MPRWRRSAPRTQRTHGGDDRGSLGEAVPYPGPWHTTYPRPEGREPTRRRTWPTCESRAAPSVPHPGSFPCAPPQLASPLRWSSYNTLRRHSRRRSPLVVYRPPRAWRWRRPGLPRGTIAVHRHHAHRLRAGAVPGGVLARHDRVAGLVDLRRLHDWRGGLYCNLCKRTEVGAAGGQQCGNQYGYHHGHDADEKARAEIVIHVLISKPPVPHWRPVSARHLTMPLVSQFDAR